MRLMTSLRRRSGPLNCQPLVGQRVALHKLQNCLQVRSVWRKSMHPAHGGETSSSKRCDAHRHDFAPSRRFRLQRHWESLLSAGVRSRSALDSRPIVRRFSRAKKGGVRLTSRSSHRARRRCFGPVDVGGVSGAPYMVLACYGRRSAAECT